MKRILVNRVTAVIVFVAILLCIPMVAYAYPDSHSLNYPTVQQEKSLWCWAASGCSVIRYYGGNVSQSDFVYALRGNVNDEGGSILHIQQGLSNYSISSIVVEDPLTMAQIRTNTYSNRRPVVAAIYYRFIDMGHAVVVIGYGDYTISSDQYVVYMDPADGQIHTAAYSQFVDSNSQEWFASLTNIH